jgi:hypothetical protein
MVLGSDLAVGKAAILRLDRSRFTTELSLPRDHTVLGSDLAMHKAAMLRFDRSRFTTELSVPRDQEVLGSDLAIRHLEAPPLRMFQFLEVGFI